MNYDNSLDGDRLGHLERFFVIINGRKRDRAELNYYPGLNTDNAKFTGISAIAQCFSAIADIMIMPRWRFAIRLRRGCG